MIIMLLASMQQPMEIGPATPCSLVADLGILRKELMERHLRSRRLCHDFVQALKVCVDPIIGTIVLTAVLVGHMPDVSQATNYLRTASPEQLRTFGSDVPHALIGLALLIGILVLNIFKPKGMTRYGWKKAQI